MINYIEEYGGCTGESAPDEVESGVIDELANKLKQIDLKGTQQCYY